jgi:hypothetical protein
MKSGRLAILAAVFLAGSFGATFGQATNEGDISGSVTDTTGAAIPGATITVANIATGVSGSYTSNSAGVYDTGSILAGNYKITYTKDGFTTLVHSSITVNV